jgi:hypothetical protein
MASTGVRPEDAPDPPRADAVDDDNITLVYAWDTSQTRRIDACGSEAPPPG